MAFGYDFVDLTDEQKHERRILLDRYAYIAQASALVFLACIAAFRLFPRPRSSTFDNPSEYDSPSSPHVKHASLKGLGKGKDVRHSWIRFKWFMSRPVGENWGTVGEWACGSVWVLWMLFLCVNQTGNGTMHFLLPCHEFRQ